MASKEAPAFRHGEGSHIRGDVLSGVHNYTNAMRLGTRVKLTIEVMEEP